MTLGLRRGLLWTTALIGLYVGGWAAFATRSFYDSFPGLGFIWISIDGPYNQHLVNDVGTLNLGFAAATLYAALLRSEAAVVIASRTVGIAWAVFSVPHLVYHARNLDGLGTADVLGQVITVGSTIVLGALLMLGPVPHRQASGRGAPRR